MNGDFSWWVLWDYPPVSSNLQTWQKNPWPKWRISGSSWEKFLEKWGEFHGIPWNSYCHVWWHRSGKKVTSSDLKGRNAVCLRSSFLLAWLSFPAEEVTLQMLVKVWLGCGCFVGPLGPMDLEIDQLCGSKKLGIPIPSSHSQQKSLAVGGHPPTIWYL